MSTEFSGINQIQQQLYVPDSPGSLEFQRMEPKFPSVALANARTISGMTIKNRVQAVLERTGLSNAKLAEHFQAIATDAGLPLWGIGYESIRQWRSDPDEGKRWAMPNVVGLYCLAKFADVDLQWLIDGTDPEGDEPVSELDEDARFVLRVWRAQKIDADEAVRRLSQPSSSAPIPVNPDISIVAVRDQTEGTRRRLGMGDDPLK